MSGPHRREDIVMVKTAFVRAFVAAGGIVALVATVGAGVKWG
jgi:hypothetical protein